MSGCRRHTPNSDECSLTYCGSMLIKSAASKVSRSVVTVLTYNIPDNMLRYFGGLRLAYPPSSMDENKPVFWGSGIIIACESDSDRIYSTTILIAATMFKRKSDVKPHEIKVDVYFSGGVRFSAEVICCDYHYNLATIRVQTNFPSPVATLMKLDDNLLLEPTELFDREHRSFQLRRHSDAWDDNLLLVPNEHSDREHQHFQLRRHSDAMKILPRELVIAIGRFPLDGDYTLKITPVFFSEKQFSEDCPEVYGLDCCSTISDHGGPVINYFGEVIGFRFHNYGQLFTPFLPTNVISRWLSYQKKFGEFRRPWLGMEICNLHAVVDLNLLERFRSISSGVFVTKVQDDSPAKSAKICCNQVIVQCDGVDVRSVSELFERIWEKVGDDSVIELTIVRLHKSRKSRVVHRTRTLRILETTSDNFYRWDLPPWIYER